MKLQGPAPKPTRRKKRGITTALLVTGLIAGVEVVRDVLAFFRMSRK